MNIPRSTIKSTIKKCKEYGTTTNLPREGRPPKLTDQARKAIIRGNKETKDSPERAAKLNGRDWSICPLDHFKPYTPQSWALQKSGKKKAIAFKEKNMQTRLVFAKRHVGGSPNIWKKVLWSDETKM